MGADELQCLLVFGIFVTGMVDKRLNDLTAVIFLAVYAGDVAFSQAALFHFAFGPAQLPGTIQIPRFTALEGFPIFTAVPAVCTAATNFLCTIHWEELRSVR